MRELSAEAGNTSLHQGFESAEEGGGKENQTSTVDDAFFFILSIKGHKVPYSPIWVHLSIYIVILLFYLGQFAW